MDAMPAEATLPHDGEITALIIPQLILEAWRLRFSGQLHLENQNQRRQILLHDGAPVQLISDRPADSLARFLHQSGRLSEKDVRVALDHARSEGGHEGVAIMKLGLMDTRSLFSSIQAQLERCIGECFGWNGGHYRLDPDNPPSPELAPFRLDPLPTVQRGLEQALGSEILLAELEKRLDQPPHSHVHTQSVWKRLRHSDELDPASWSPERNLAENLMDTRLSLHDASALWTLMASGGLSFESAMVAERIPVTESSRPAPPLRAHPPREKANPDETDRFERELEARLQEENTADHYSLLRVTPDCSSREIRKAYLKAAKQYHPDTTLKYFRDDLKAKSAALFAQITEAFEVLGDPQKREHYDAQLRGAPTEPAADQVAQAEMGYQKANVLLRMGQFKEAIVYLEQAVALVPDEEDFHAALGWALFKMAPSEPRRARKALRKAIELKSDHALAHFRLGIVCRSLGDTEAAEEALGKAKQLEGLQAQAG